MEYLKIPKCAIGVLDNKSREVAWELRKIFERRNRDTLRGRRAGAV
jgi:hypothetical protein